MKTRVDKIVKFPNSGDSSNYSRLSNDNFLATIKLALTEDIGSGDVTSSLVPRRQAVTATVICREDAVIAGKDWFNAVIMALDPFAQVQWFVNDGEFATANTKLVQIFGNARAILSAERTALNFLQTLSGTATRVKHYVDAVAGTSVKILDTRKTLPCLREAQKYAVTCGGGVNHRYGLYDEILIKENHIYAAGSITNAVRNAKRQHPDIKIEVEAENLDQLEEAINAGANVVLLDNMDIETLKRAVEINENRVKLEASGGIELKNVRAIAETGVDFISIGGMTKHLSAVDLSMRFNY